jgi:hypothetical protein
VTPNRSIDGRHVRRASAERVLLPGASADWQIVRPDGTTLGDVRLTLQTAQGELLYVRSQGVRHGSAKVLALALRSIWMVVCRRSLDAERVQPRSLNFVFDGWSMLQIHLGLPGILRKDHLRSDHCAPATHEPPTKTDLCLQ